MVLRIKHKHISKKLGITLTEREIIEMRLKGGWTLKMIAGYLNRHYTSIKREINRNDLSDGTYDAKHAQRLAGLRKSHVSQNTQDRESRQRLYFSSDY
jgi:IS30 family transposase